MAGILELSDQECKTLMSNVLRAVMNKVDHAEQMSNPQKNKNQEKED